MSDTSAQLKRNLTLPLFTFYGLGSILGAGIYALVGKVAGDAGMFTPFAFVIAALLAGFTGFSYAELAARYPRSGGEAIYVKKVFGVQKLTLIVGLLAALSATVSAGALSNAFVGYLNVFMEIDRTIVISAIVLIAFAIAAWGIKESAVIAMIFTLIEVGGLLLIVWVGRDGFMDIPTRASELMPPMTSVAWGGIMLGAFTAFYSFIGFEDMANVAEEVKDPNRTIPIGIIAALIMATVMYCLIALVCVLSLSPEVLGESDAPLALIYETKTGGSPIIITFIGLFAIVNGLLVQIVVASRMLYGLSVQKCLPKILSVVHPKTRTPLNATILIALFVLVLALWLPLVQLARITSFIILILFSLVNLACIRAKQLEPKPEGVKTFPMAIPVTGLIVTVAFVGYQLVLLLL